MEVPKQIYILTNGKSMQLKMHTLNFIKASCMRTGQQLPADLN